MAKEISAAKGSTVTVIRGEFAGCKAVVRDYGHSFDYRSRKYTYTYQLDVIVCENGSDRVTRMVSIPQKDCK
jgi:hypothetical protein